MEQARLRRRPSQQQPQHPRPTRFACEPKSAIESGRQTGRQMHSRWPTNGSPTRLGSAQLGPGQVSWFASARELRIALQVSRLAGFARASHASRASNLVSTPRPGPTGGPGGRSQRAGIRKRKRRRRRRKKKRETQARRVMDARAAARIYLNQVDGRAGSYLQRLFLAFHLVVWVVRAAAAAAAEEETEILCAAGESGARCSRQLPATCWAPQVTCEPTCGQILTFYLESYLALVRA